MLRFLISMAVTMITAPVSAQSQWVDEGHVRDCFAYAGIGEVQPRCLGSASNECQARPGGSTTIGIASCIQAESAVWDAILNEQYQATRAALNARAPQLGEALLQAQRAWIGFRDAECSLTYERWIGGTIRSIAHANCLLGFTSERAIGLRDMRGGQ